MSIQKTYSVRTRCQGHESGGYNRRRKEKLFSTPWQLLVAVVALLDFLSTLSNRRLFIHSTSSKDDDELLIAHFRIFGRNWTIPAHQTIIGIFLWLDAYSVHFGFLFSVLWCIEAFMIAERNAMHALKEWDRREELIILKAILDESDPNTTTTTTTRRDSVDGKHDTHDSSSISNNKDTEPMVVLTQMDKTMKAAVTKRRESVDGNGMDGDGNVMKRTNKHATTTNNKPSIVISPQSVEYERFKTYSVYWASLILQLLFLPMGFYLIIIQFARMKTATLSSSFSFSITGTAYGALVSPQNMTTLLESTYEYVDLPNEYRTFSNETKLSLGFAIAKHSGKAVYNVVHTRLHKEIWKFGWLEGRRLGWNFLRHPVRTFHNTQWVLYWIRWILYLLPLVQGFLKMRNGVQELLLTWKQRQQQKLARIQRRRQLRRMSQQQRKDRAAKIIQSTYRSYEQRQTCIEMLLSRRETDDRAARKLQSALRTFSDKAKAKVEAHKRELARLEQKEQQFKVQQVRHRRDTLFRLRRGRRDNISSMDPKERKRLGMLRNQINNLQKRRIDRRLLMRPDSRFQIFWRSLFIVVVVLEMIAYSFNQRLAKQQSSMGEEIQKYLIPLPVIERKECFCLAKARGDSLKWERFRFKKKRWKCDSEPWYCAPYYLHLQSVYTDLILFLKNRFVGFLALVALLDVPVNFYKGVYHPDTGVLLPKPFFQRWPSVFLQLLINPRFETASTVVFKLLKSSFQVGPIRVARWSRALFSPGLLLFLDFMEWSVWLPIVSFCNRKQQLPATPSTRKEGDTSTTSMRRRSSIDSSRFSIFAPVRTTSSGCVPALTYATSASSRGSLTYATRTSSGGSFTFTSRFSVLDDSYYGSTGKKFRWR